MRTYMWIYILVKYTQISSFLSRVDHIQKNKLKEKYTIITTEQMYPQKKKKNQLLKNF